MQKASAKKEIPLLAVGPMSPEIVEAVFYYSNFFRKPLMLIASKNQIDHAGGYVNGWTTKEYMQYVGEMRKQYPMAQVKICRDHCGPGFNGNHDLKDVYKTIEADIKAGFDLIHIDFCHYKGTKDEKLQESKKAVLHCLKMNPKIELEIGTDENMGTNYSLPNLKEWEREIDFFQSFCTPTFYVVQTGSLVMEINQVGNFNKAFTGKVAELIRSKGLKMKEHNADYLSKEDIRERAGLVDAMNNAPQFGVVQTQTVLTRALIYGIKIEPFLDVVYKGGKWKKWMKDNTPENKMLCSMIAGHYHFTSKEYKEIIRQLSEREDIKQAIVNSMVDIIRHYVEG
jgi:hypothetical protein